jgi:membrane protein required for colicin V production
MTGLDVAVIVVITLSALLGLWRGVIREVFALAAWVAAVVCMFLFGTQLAQALPLGQFTQGVPWVRTLIGYALMFVGVFVVLSVAGFLFSKAISAIGLSFVDRALGMVFGVIRGVLIVVLLVFVAGATTLPQFAWWRDSVTAKPLATIAAILRNKLPGDLAKQFKFAALVSVRTRAEGSQLCVV